MKFSTRAVVCCVMALALAVMTLPASETKEMGSGSKSAKSGPAGCTMACCAGKEMAYKLGSTVADIELANAATGEKVKLSSLAGSKATAVIFWNQKCPFVQEALARVKDFQGEYGGQGVNIVAIDAGVNNDEAAQKEHAGSLAFPLLVNRDSMVAGKFAANHTPEVFLLNSEMKIVYHGAFDSGENKTESGSRESYLQNAVNEMLAGKAISMNETKAFGCTIKWAEGAKPAEKSDQG